MVNTNRESLSYRLEAIGIREFKTYWMGSSTSIHVGIGLSNTPEIAQQRRLAILQKLKPYVVQGDDLEYADILCEAGKYYFDVHKDYETAISYFEQAKAYQPTLSRNVYYLVITNFMLGRFQDANSYSLLLTRVWHPTREKAYKIAIHVALQAKDYTAAQTYCDEYLSTWPGDGFIIQIRNVLISGKNRNKTKELFRQE